jgi:hypothetical protein
VKVTVFAIVMSGRSAANGRVDQRGQPDGRVSAGAAHLQDPAEQRGRIEGDGRREIRAGR